MLNIVLIFIIFSVPLASMLITLRNVYRFLKSESVDDLFFRGYEYIPVVLSVMLNIAINFDSVPSTKATFNLIISLLTLILLFVIMIEKIVKIYKRYMKESGGLCGK